MVMKVLDGILPWAAAQLYMYAHISFCNPGRCLWFIPLLTVQANLPPPPLVRTCILVRVSGWCPEACSFIEHITPCHVFPINCSKGRH